MTGQAVDRYQAPPAPAELTDREMSAIEWQAQAITTLDQRVKGDKAKGLALAITLYSLGVPVTITNAKKLHLINGEAFESAQLLLGLLTMHGHDVRVVEESEERAVVRGRRFGQGEPHEATYTIDRARRSGALDEWVQRKYRNQGDNYDRTEKITVAVDGSPVPGPHPDWVAKQIEAGKVFRNDYWFKYREDALLNRAIRRLAKRMGADAMLGVGGPLDEDERPPAHRVEPQADDVEADVIDAPSVDLSMPEEPAPPQVAATADGADPAALHRNECTRVAAAMGRIPDGTWRQLWAKAWREAGLPASAHDLAPEQLEPARLLIRQYLALAALDAVGVTNPAARHAFVSGATDGATESTKALTAEQLQAVLVACDAEADRAAAAAEAEAGTEYGPGEEPF